MLAWAWYPRYNCSNLDVVWAALFSPTCFRFVIRYVRVIYPPQGICSWHHVFVCSTAGINCAGIWNPSQWSWYCGHDCIISDWQHIACQVVLQPQCSQALSGRMNQTIPGTLKPGECIQCHPQVCNIDTNDFDSAASAFSVFCAFAACDFWSIAIRWCLSHAQCQDPSSLVSGRDLVSVFHINPSANCLHNLGCRLHNPLWRIALVFR